MKTCNAHLSVLLAGLLAAAGVQAQSTSAGGSSDLPPKAGEASTQTRGVPNAATTNSPAGEAPSSKDAIRQDAQGMSGAAATSSVPPKAGEASTTVRGQPNANPDDPNVAKSSSQQDSSKDAIRQDAQGLSGAATTSSVPGKAGEASTTVRGQPNANPDDPNLAKSRAQKDAESAGKTMGSAGSDSTVK
jgi:hypothetical protein